MMDNQRDRLILIFIVGLALLVRFLMLFFVVPPGDPGMSLVGEARNVYQGLGYSLGIMTSQGLQLIPSVYDVPGYALLLAGSWKIFGTAHEFLPLQILQILIDSSLCLLIAALGREVFGRRIGLIAALLFAIYLPEANFAATGRRDVWATFGVMGAAWFYWQFIRTGRLKPMVFLGLVLGLSCYFKATLLLLPIALSAGLPHGFWKTAKGAFVALFVIWVCLLPWGIRNYQAYGRWIFTRCTLAQNMWVGFGEFPNPMGAVTSEEITLRQMQAEGFQGPSNSTLEFEDFIKVRVKKAIQEHPLWYAGAVLRRIPMALVANRIPWGVGQNEGLTYHRMFQERTNEKSMFKYLGILARQNPGFLITKCLDIILLCGFLAGMLLARKDWKKWAFLATIPVYFIAIHIPIHVEGRYMVPAHWVYILFAASALSAAYEAYLRRRVRGRI